MPSRRYCAQGIIIFKVFADQPKHLVSAYSTIISLNPAKCLIRALTEASALRRVNFMKHLLLQKSVVLCYDMLLWPHTIY